MLRKKWLVLAVLVLAGLAVVACAPTAPEQVVVTVQVQGPAGETTVVTATPSGPAMAEGPIPAEGMVACNPLPSMAISHDVGVAAPAAPAVRPLSIDGTHIASPAAQAGKVYKVGVFEDVTTINFWGANGPDNTVWNSYMLPPRLGLYGLAPRTFQFVPGLATDAVPAPLVQEGDMWTSTIPMRQGIMWSDGTPVTAADVAFTGNTSLRINLISGGWGSTWFDPAYLDHIEAVDANTVKFVYHTKPGLARHEYGNLQAPILQEAFWKPLVDTAAAPIDALGANPNADDLTAAQTEASNNLYAIDPTGEPLAGSFLFKTWEAGAYLENDTNTNFYDTGTTVIQYANGAYQETPANAEGFTLYGDASGDIDTQWTVGPDVGAVVYTIYGSQDAALLALRNGDVDFVLNSLGLQKGLADQVRNDPNVTVIQNNTNGFRYLSFNNRRRPMNDCSFRQAVAVLIDKEFVTQTILQGVAFPLYTYVPEGNAAWYFTDVPKLGQGLSREERLNLAIAILDQAGYTWEGGTKPTWDPDNLQVVPGGNLIMPDGTPVPALDLWAPSAGYDPLRSTFAIWIETWLKEAGIPVTANLAGFNVLVPRIFTDQNFDMYILGWSLTIFPDYLNDFFSTAQAAQDGNNAGGYVNPEFDALGQQILSCDSIDACKQISDQIQTKLATETPYVILFDTGIIEAYRSASVDYPFTESLAGLQYQHQGGGTMQSMVLVK